MSPRRALSLWGPVAGLAALVFVLSHQPSVLGAQLLWDKLLHAAGYTVLGVAAQRATHGGMTAVRPGPALAAVLLTIGYGVLDEIHQSTVPGRESSPADAAADAVGAVMAVWVFVAARRWVSRARVVESAPLSPSSRRPSDAAPVRRRPR